MDSNARSPLLIHLKESYSGAAVLRAFQQMDDYTTTADELINTSSQAFYTFNSAGRWFAGLYTPPTCGTLVELDLVSYDVWTLGCSLAWFTD